MKKEKPNPKRAQLSKEELVNKVVDVWQDLEDRYGQKKAFEMICEKLNISEAEGFAIFGTVVLGSGDS